MSVSYINELLTREEFYDRAFQKWNARSPKLGSQKWH